MHVAWRCLTQCTYCLNCCILWSFFVKYRAWYVVGESMTSELQWFLYQEYFRVLFCYDTLLNIAESITNIFAVSKKILILFWTKICMRRFSPHWHETIFETFGNFVSSHFRGQWKNSLYFALMLLLKTWTVYQSDFKFRQKEIINVLKQW